MIIYSMAVQWIHVSLPLQDKLLRALHAGIISPHWEQIAHDIMYRIRRGVTISTAKGGCSGREMEVLYAVIVFREWAHLKRIVRESDPDAFVVVTDSLEVIGQGIGNQPRR